MKTNKIHKIFIFFVAVVIIAGAVIASALMPVATAFADLSFYSNVLQDLQKDNDFNVNDYPDNQDDYDKSQFAKIGNFYAVHVIQVAESTDGVLFVYTYQPCQNTMYLTATEINMSLTDKMGNEADEDLSSADRPKLYNLTLLNCDGVFCKYKVNDYTVSGETVRFYNIASVYREWIKGIDEGTGNDNIKNAVAFTVGKCYKAITENGEVSYSCESRKTIKIINPYADFLRYKDGFFLKTTACDSHYVAFSTDLNVDELYEADLAYRSRSVHYYHAFMQGGKTDYGEWKDEYAFLTDEQEFIKERTGWLCGTEKKYSRIQRVSDFIKSESLADETKENLKGKEWVLRFAETDCTFIYDGSDQGNNYWSEVSNVTILRLKFKSASTVYNLGAVSDKVTGDNKPGNVAERSSFWKYVWNCIVKLFKGTASFIETVVAVIALLVVLVLLPLAIFILSMVFPAFGAVVKIILKAIGKGLLWLFKGIWWLVCLPFKGIAALVRKKRGK